MDITLAQNIVKKLTMINLPTGLKQRLLDAALILDDESLKQLDEVLTSYQNLDDEIKAKFNHILEQSEKRYSDQKEKNEQKFLNDLDNLSKEVDLTETIVNS